MTSTASRSEPSGWAVGLASFAGFMLVLIGSFQFFEGLGAILKDEYFVEKKLYPNIDFYSGITLKAMGFPTSMFTVLFALARTVGWIAQWSEMIEDPSQRIGRPRQLYTGSPERDYVTVAQRG